MPQDIIETISKKALKESSLKGEQKPFEELDKTILQALDARFHAEVVRIAQDMSGISDIPKELQVHAKEISTLLKNVR